MEEAALPSDPMAHEHRFSETGGPALGVPLGDLADRIPHWVWTTDAAGKPLFFNRRARDYLGAVLEQVADGWLAAIHPEDQRRAVRAWEDSRRSGKPMLIEVRLRRARDGRFLWHRLHVAPVLGAGGEVAGWVGTTTFTNDQRRLEAAERTLRATEHRFRTAIDAAGAMIYETDLDGGEMVALDGLERLIGEDSAQRRTRDWWLGCIHPDDLADCLFEVEQASAAQRDFTLEYRVRHRDGHWLVIEEHARVIYDPSGRPRRHIGVMIDVTARRAAQDALSEADQRKDEFLAMLGHELRNPLAAIAGAIELLDAPGAEARSRAILRRQVGHMSRLVDELLDVARIRHGRVPLECRRLDLRGVIEAALASVSVAGREHEVHVELGAAAIPIDADAMRLEQVLVNVLDNAFSFTPAGGRIHVAATSRGGDAIICVRDEGIGIEPELLPHVCEAFVQGVSERARGGLGVGLCLVKTLIEAHRGSVEVRSAGRDAGTEVILRLPRAEPELAATEPPPTTGEGRRVLVVDDNTDAAWATAELLQARGHQVEVAHDGLRAIEVASDFHPEIVLLDIGLPGMDGYELARQFRGDDHGESAMIVAVTGFGREEDKALAHAAGFDHHFTKPVDWSQLFRLLE